MELVGFDELVAYEVADKAIPSISYILFDKNDVLEWRNVTSGAALRDDALFRIGSVSKTFAAILAMRLGGQGKLDPDADIAAVIDGFSPVDPLDGEPVTLRKLLGHRSGLTREAGAGGYLDPHPPTLAATVEGLARSRLKAASDGSQYHYSNAGYAVVGRAVELTAGAAYAEHMTETILTPLGLAATAIVLTPHIRARLAPARMWTAAGDAAAPLFDLGSAPAGNMTASLADIARWGQILLSGGEGLVDGEALASMWARASHNSARGYGLGFALDRLDGWRSVGHGGAVYGYSSVLSLLPDAGLGVAVISTLDFTGDLVGRLARRALRLALANRGLGPRPEAPRRLPMAGANLARALAGRYVAPDGDAIELRPWADRLMLIEAGVPLELRPLGSNRFALDGRLHGEDTPHSFPIVEIDDHAGLYWRDHLWQRSATRPAATPPDLAVYLGDYDPTFMPTRLSFANGRLSCLIENLSPHECVPLGGKRFLMRGPMYEGESLELGVRDADGHAAIRVGEVILSKRRP